MSIALDGHSSAPSPQSVRTGTHHDIETGHGRLFTLPSNFGYQLSIGSNGGVMADIQTELWKERNCEHVTLTTTLDTFFETLKTYRDIRLWDSSRCCSDESGYD